MSQFTIRSLLPALVFAGFSLSTIGCTGDDTAGFRNALTGEECVPDIETYVARDENHGNTSPTGIAGDNLDDERSGQIDCLGDGNSGQGDDRRHDCTFPPGCDAEGCCDDDLVPEPQPEPEPEPDNGGGDTPDDNDPEQDDNPEEDPVIID